jgi:predicted RND superfamily exporter protein
MKNFWLRIAENILKFKFQILGILVVLTCVLGFKASQIQLSYELAKILPKSDERFQLYENFKSKYGEDGNVMVIGFQDKNLFQYQKFKDWNELSKTIKNIQSLESLSGKFNFKKMDS